MKAFFIAAIAAVCVGFAGCASVAQDAGTFQAQVAKACAVVQPTLLSVQAMTASDPVQQLILGQVVKDNSALCAANASLDPSTVSSLVNTSIPAAVQVVGSLPIDGAAKTSVQIGLMAFQVALSAALAQFGSPVVAPVPASAPIGASA